MRHFKAPDSHAMDELLYAIVENNLSNVRYFLHDKLVNPNKLSKTDFWMKENDKSSRVQTSPLLLACEHQNAQIVELLLTNAADVNMADKNGLRPIFVAVETGNTEIAGMLLSKGKTALQTECLVSFGTLYTPLLRAVMLEDIAMVELLLKAGADVKSHILLHAKSKHTCADSPLSVAEQHQDAAMCSLLMKYGADSNNITEPPKKRRRLHKEEQNGVIKEPSTPHYPTSEYEINRPKDEYILTEPPKKRRRLHKEEQNGVIKEPSSPHYPISEYKINRPKDEYIPGTWRAVVLGKDARKVGVKYVRVTMAETSVIEVEDDDREELSDQQLLAKALMAMEISDGDSNSDSNGSDDDDDIGDNIDSNLAALSHNTRSSASVTQHDGLLSQSKLKLGVCATYLS